MRILRLDLGRSVGTLDLHPFVTVVSDLSRQEGDAMAEAIRGIVRGSTDGLGGLIENRGDLIEIEHGADGRLGLLTTEDIIFGLHELVGDPASLASLEAERDQLQRRADLDAVFVEQVRADLDPTSAAQVHRLREILDGSSMASVDTDMLARADRVREQLAAVDALPSTVAEVPESIEALLESWASYTKKRDQAKRHLSLLTGRVEVCETNLTDALRHQAAAAEAAVPLLLSREDDSRLEDLANPASGSGRRRRKKKHEEDAEAEEIASLLAKVEQHSYTSYVMHRLNPAPPAAKVEALTAASFAVERAEAALLEARAELEIDPVASDLDYDLQALREASRVHLGAVLPDDLGAGLSAVLDYRENPEWVSALADLRELLIESGATAANDADQSGLAAVAVDWLAEVELQTARDREFDPVLVTAELEAAEKAFRRHAKSMAQIDRFEARSNESARRCGELSQQIDRLRAGKASNADHLLATLRPALDRILVEAGVPVPVIVWGELEDLPDNEITQLFNGLEALSQEVQIVYVAESKRILKWVESAGLRRAMRSTVVNVRS